jgi:hypothetical protein
MIMRKTFTSGLLTAAAAMALIVPCPVSAQTTDRVWDEGTVWSITYVETKPNMFNDYIKNLSQVWRRFLEEQKKIGDVISYKILQVQNVRDGEPDLILLTEFKNMAVFDRGVDWFEELSKKVMGSLDNMQSDNVDREKLRTIRSTILTREIRFK